MSENDTQPQPARPAHPVEPVTADQPVGPRAPVWPMPPGNPYQRPPEQQPVGPQPHQQSWYGEATAGYGFPPQQAVTPPRRGGRAVVTGLLGLLLAGGGGVIGGLVVHAADSSSATGTGATATTPTSVKVMDRSSLASIASAVKPSVVAIQTQDAEGSGVVFSTDGYIVTNNHVVADATGNTVKVNFSDGKTTTAAIVGKDPKTDLAVIKVSGVSGPTAAKFGDRSAMQVGDTVLAIGSPLGLEGSVTAGIVSALNRTIQEGSGSQQNQQLNQAQSGTDIGGAIQTDAPINPGNSGGALVNMSGEVIGINTAIATSGQGEGNIGVGFAIPSNRVKQVTQALIGGQKVSHPYIGVQVQTADGGGAVVSSVVGSGPAAKAGLQQGDVITKANGKTITTSDDLVNVVQSSKVGDQLQLTVARDGSRTVTVTIGESS
jgi:putative serine protease PepD